MRASESLISNKEKRQLFDNACKPIEKEHCVKKSSYARWTTREGYLFIIDTLFVPQDNQIFLELKVKPLYVDDLLWKILGYELPIRPFSLRIMGCDHVVSIPIFKTSWIINAVTGYDDISLSLKLQEIYKEIEFHIAAFLKENPIADKYFFFDKNWHDQMLPMMMLCHQNKYLNALDLVNDEIDKGKSGGIVFKMPDGSEKTAYQFVKEYCLKHINSQNV